MQTHKEIIHLECRKYLKKNLETEASDCSFYLKAHYIHRIYLPIISVISYLAQFKKKILCEKKQDATWKYFLTSTSFHFFFRFDVQHVSDKSGLGRQKTGRVVGCSKTPVCECVCVDQCSDKQVHWPGTRVRFTFTPLSKPMCKMIFPQAPKYVVVKKKKKNSRSV